MWPQDPGFEAALAGRRDLDADPAGLREPDRRARRDGQGRARDDLPGHEVSRRPARTEDGLRREPEARLRPRRPVPFHAHGQRRGLPPGLCGREGLRGGLEGVREPSSPSTRRTSRKATKTRRRRSRRSATSSSRRSPRSCAATSSCTTTVIAPTRWRRCSISRRSSASRSPPSITGSRPTSSRTASPQRRCMRRAVGRLVGFQDGGLRRHPGKPRARRLPAGRLCHRAFRFRGRHPAPQPGSGEGDGARPARGPRHPAGTRDPLGDRQRREGARHPRRDRHARGRQDGATSSSGTAPRSPSTRSPTRCSWTACCSSIARIPRPKPRSDFEL